MCSPTTESIHQPCNVAAGAPAINAPSNAPPFVVEEFHHTRAFARLCVSEIPKKLPDDYPRMTTSGWRLCAFPYQTIAILICQYSNTVKEKRSLARQCITLVPRDASGPTAGKLG